MKKVFLVFGLLLGVCLLYSFVSDRFTEPFANDVPMKTCKADSDCPSKFSCKDSKCMYNRPLP